MLELLLSGGATGILGGLFTGILGIINRHQDLKAQQLKFSHELRLQEMQMASLQAETERELLIADAHASAGVMSESIKHDAAIIEVSRWVNNTIKLFRPSITLYLITLTMIVYFTNHDVEIQRKITDAVVFSTITTISWWFGSRQLSKMLGEETKYRSQKLPWRK